MPPGTNGESDTSRDASAQGLSRRRILLFRAVVVLFPVLVLLLVEASCAFRFGREYSGSSLSVQGKYRFVPAPYRGYANNPGYINRRDGVRYRYNNHGFRDEEDLADKGPNEFRVFFMGGSAAYGTGARESGQYRLISGQETYPSSETISAHLQEHLGQRLPDRDVRVWNAAVVNYSIHNNYLAYLELIRSLSPDLVVTMDGWNEQFQGTNVFGDAAPVHTFAGGPLITWLRSHSYSLYYLGSFWFSRKLAARQGTVVDESVFQSMDFREVRRAFAREKAASEPDVPSLDELMKVYEAFSLAARLDRVPILFAIQPLPGLDRTKRFTSEEEELLKYLYLLGQARSSHPGDKRTWQMAHLADRLAARAAGDPDFHFLSLLSVFADYRDLAYTDYCHLSPGGNDHVARRLADYIVGVPEWTQRGMGEGAAPGGFVQSPRRPGRHPRAGGD